MADYDTSGAAARQPIYDLSETDNKDLSIDYNANQLKLIVRDPLHIFAYWRVSRAQFTQLHARLGNEYEQSQFIIRIYDISYIDFNGTNANHQFDIAIDVNSHNCYIDLWSDNVSYCAELGMLRPNGDFVCISRSNYIQTQSQQPSQRSEMVWMEVKENKPLEPFVYLQKQAEDHTSESQQAFDPKANVIRKKIQLPHDQAVQWINRTSEQFEVDEDQAQDLTHLPAKIRRKRRLLIPLSAAEILAYYSKISSALLRIRPYLRLLDNIDIFADLDEYAVENSLTGGLPKNKFYRKTKLGASEEMILTEEKRNDFEGASEELVNQSSRDFFFELETEVTVRGRTKPDATVTHEGRIIPLNADGTFELKFYLADAQQIPLNFIARSSDNVDERTISTSIHRIKTMYGSNQ